jgi:4-carboxymuconolactone decarboxylase
MRFQETLLKLAIIDEGFVEDHAGCTLGLAGTLALDPKTVALLRVAACVAIESPEACLEWSATRAMSAGASEDEITDVLLAISPVAGISRIVRAAAEVAAALGYDIASALEEPDGPDPAARPSARAMPEAPSAGMEGKHSMTGDQPENDWTVVLRRRPTRIVAGRPVGGYTDVFEIICSYCGDNPYRDYREVPPKLRRIRGPYWIEAGVAAYQQHLRVHEQAGVPVNGDGGRHISTA